jgi:predicted lipid-binding transport protein (Tim44 family)
MGFGFGGAGGAMAAIMQIAMFALAGLVIFKLIGMFRRKDQPAAAHAGGGFGSAHEVQQPAEPNRYFNLGGAAAANGPSEPSDEIGVTQADLDTFEQLLKQVQTAFGAEDYAALRAVTTPEIMSYLSEELSQNATGGRRNEVTDITLDQADLSEAWHEDGDDYATAAMRYSSRDIMRDRATGAVISGDEQGPSQTTELWTFVRQSGQPWKLSAIQDA